MTEIPKLVHGRLRAAVSGNSADGSHLDANALNAFAEQALSLTEREGVLAHLALCATCRDVILTALPEVAVPEPMVSGESETRPTFVPKTRRRKALLWPSLRWGVLAAGIVTAILLARPGFEHLTNSARNRASSAVQQPTVADLGSPTTVGKSGTEAKSDALASAELTKAQANASGNRQSRTATGSANHAISGQKKASEPLPVIAENRSSSVDHPFASGSKAAAIVRAKPALGTLAPVQKTPSPGQSSMQDEMPGSFSEALKESPQWAVEAGSLKRSLDGGQSWQTVLQPASSLLCYASRGGQMWAGGQGGTLLHSADGGANWSAITVSVGGNVLNSNIKNISVQDAAVIVLTTTDGEQLASNDGGTTWEQK